MNELREWLKVFVPLAVACGAGGVWLWRQVVALIEGKTAEERKDRTRAEDSIKERLVKVADDAHVAVGKAELLERQSERSTTDREHIHERIGVIASRMDALEDIVRRCEVSKLEELGAIRERMIAIETKLDTKFDLQNTNIINLLRDELRRAGHRVEP